MKTKALLLFAISTALIACSNAYTNSLSEMATGNGAPTGPAFGVLGATPPTPKKPKGPKLKPFFRMEGIDSKLELEPEYVGNAYLAEDRPHLPTTLRDARDLFAESTVARDAFGQEVVDHYLNYARTEQELFDRVVTNWERERLYERG